MVSPRTFVAFDLETTGLSPRSDEVIEIGAVRFDAGLRVLDRLDLLVDPGRPVPLAVQRLTGLDPTDLAGALTPVEAVGQLAEFADGAELVAHGAGFDLAFCTAHVPRAFTHRTVYDTLELARILLPTAPSHGLGRLCAELGIEHLRPHRAGSDADATRLLFGRLIDLAAALPPGVLAAVRQLLAGLDLPLARFFRDLVGGPLAPPAPPPVATGMATDTAPPSPRSGRRGLAATAAAALGPDGPFAADPDYELREAQVEMARAVGQVLERGGRLLVEAPTGVGKSLAYLVPLALWCHATGRRAVVATHTITLQEQLVERDLPRVLQRLGLPLRVAVLKGRQHQLSLRRWARFVATAPHGDRGQELEVLRFKLKILVWLAQTSTGDRSELHLSGAEEALWRRVQSDPDDCLGAGCANWQSGRCFMVAGRRAAGEADLVVTNHALLLAATERQGRVLPPFDVLVIDEAHRLEETATTQLGHHLTAPDVLSVVDRLSPRPGSELAAALAAARDAVTRLFGEVKGGVQELLGTDVPANADVGLGPTTRSQPAVQRIVRAGHHAHRALDEAVRALREGSGESALSIELLPQPDRAAEELETAATALAGAATAIERVLLTPRAGHVAWLALRAEQGEIHEAPITVAPALTERLFDGLDAVVVTSATLAVGGDLGFIRSRTGIGEGAEELVLRSPFDYLSQALSVLVGDMPPYDDEAYDEAMAELCADVARCLGGRTLVLFTGYAPLRAVHTLLQPRLASAGIAVLGQGLNGTRRQVLASFVANPRSVLLGTSSFWEGVDVPGEALAAVILAKLPFPVPTDPLVQARSATLRDPFVQLLLPTAVLRLRQGFGRLIRRSADRGAVVLCDSRLATREYGRAFLAALPEARIAVTPRARVGVVVEEFVHRGTAPAEAATLADLEGRAPVAPVAAVSRDPSA